MADDSHLDRKYFIDKDVYNCPYCNRNNVEYVNVGRSEFDWSVGKICWIWLVRCSSCGKISMHLTFDDLGGEYVTRIGGHKTFKSDVDLDVAIFYSVPTSFFTIDNRIPGALRELLSEADGCLKMNFLTGASACVRKAIYEFALREEAIGDDYKSRIKSLKEKFTDIDPKSFDLLSNIQDMTSEKVHEQSWDKWSSAHLKLFIEVLKTILHEIYVLPKERESRGNKIQQLIGKIKGDKSTLFEESGGGDNEVE